MDSKIWALVPRDISFPVSIARRLNSAQVCSNTDEIPDPCIRHPKAPRKLIHMWKPLSFKTLL